METVIRPLTKEDLPTVPLIIDGVSTCFFRLNRIVPIELRNNVLKIVAADHVDEMIVDALKVAISGDVELYPVDNNIIEDYLSRFYDTETQNMDRIIINNPHGWSSHCFHYPVCCCTAEYKYEKNRCD